MCCVTMLSLTKASDRNDSNIDICSNFCFQSNDELVYNKYINIYYILWTYINST